MVALAFVCSAFAYFWVYVAMFLNALARRANSRAAQWNARTKSCIDRNEGSDS